MSPLVIVIILTFNGMKHIKKCLDSLQNQQYDNLKILLVDNLSQDGTLEFVQNNYPEVSCKRNTYNAGFSEGNNIGIKLALKFNPAYVLILNDDTESDPLMIKNLVITAENDENTKIVAPKVMHMYDRNKLQGCGIQCDRFGYPVKHPGPTPDNFFYVSGVAMLFRSDLFHKIGFFDKKYFAFSEDLDICWRTRLMGYTITVEPKAILYHTGGGTMKGGIYRGRGHDYKLNKERVYLRERNTIRTLIKNYSTANLFKFLPLYIILLAVESLYVLIRMPSLVTIYPAVIGWNIKNLKSSLNERKKIQNMRLIPDDEILKKMSKGWGKLEIARKIGLGNISS